MSNAFSKTLSVVSVIEYHDGPLLFTAEDPIGTRYICAFLETKPTGTEYLCVPLSPARFNSFLNGARDLRSLFEEPEIAEFYKIVTLADDAQWLIATPLEMGSVQRDLFPAAGYFVPPSEWHPKEVERNHSLVEASIEVQEALNHPLIETDTLSEFLTGIQDALRFACRRAISERPKEDRQGRSYQLLSRTELYDFSHSSFKVKLRSGTSSRELFPFGDFDRAVEMLAMVIELAGKDPAQAHAFLRENRGHFVSAVRRLIKVPVARGCGMSIGWRLNTANSAYRIVRATFDQIRSLQALLSAREELAIENAEYTGIFTDLYTENKPGWAFHADDGTSIRGEVDPQDKAILSGVPLRTVRYKIFCREQMVSEGSGKLWKRVTLYRHEPAKGDPPNPS